MALKRRFLLFQGKSHRLRHLGQNEYGFEAKVAFSLGSHRFFNTRQSRDAQVGQVFVSLLCVYPWSYRIAFFDTEAASDLVVDVVEALHLV